MMIDRTFFCVIIQHNTKCIVLSTAFESAMFHNSSQKKFWTFDKEETLDKLRSEANQKFCTKALSSGKVSAY